MKCEKCGMELRLIKKSSDYLIYWCPECDKYYVVSPEHQ